MDQRRTKHPKCPHCGWELTDIWDYGLVDEEAIEIECEDCEKSFRLITHFDVSYTIKAATERGGDE